MIAGIDPGGPAASSSLRAATGTIVLDGTTYSTGGDIVTAANGTKRSPAPRTSRRQSARSGPATAWRSAVVRPDGSRDDRHADGWAVSRRRARQPQGLQP